MDEGKGELGTSVGDDTVIKTESGKDVVKKDVGDVGGRGSFVARAENYPLWQAMVYHDQDRVIAMGQRGQ